MKKKLRITKLTGLVLTILLTMNLAVFANEAPLEATTNDISADIISNEGYEFTLGHLEAVDLDAISDKLMPANISKPQIRAASSLVPDVLGEPDEREIALDSPDIHFDDETDFAQDKQNKASENKPQGRAASNVSYAAYEVSDVLTAVGQQYPVYPIWLEPGEILQAQLTIPQSTSLDYDLYLYAFNMSTGNLVSNPIDVSTLATTNAYTPECVGTINTSGADAAYALFVVSYTGSSSTTPFTLNFSMGAVGSFDNGETNESPFTAVAFPSLGDGGQYFSFDANINTPYDNDWFYIDIPNQDNYSSIFLTPSGNPVNIETYAISGGTVVRTAANSTNNSYPVVQGRNYIRISAKPGAFNSSNYSIRVDAELEVEYMDFDYIVDNTDCLRASTNFTDWQKRPVLLAAKNFEWRVTYYNIDGYPVRGVYNPLKLHYWNPLWGYRDENPTVPNDHGNRVATAYKLSNEDGWTRCVVEAGSLLKPNSNGTGWEQVVISFFMPESVGTVQEQQFALINKYNNGEKNKNCYFHNFVHFFDPVQD